ncbi:MAG: hypothetical protein JNJ71_16130 [Rubrivivax sp.]|nr:hypothetical protein [Rubrivivax sp.]
MTATDGFLWAFVALAFIAALALLASNWPRWAKALLVLSVTGLYFAADRSLDDVWGWPSRQALPERFVLLAAVIEEPNKTSAGALYVWVTALEMGKPAGAPRAFRLPYTKDLHALLSEGMKKVRQGVSQMGTAEPKTGPKGLSWLRPGSDEQNVKIRDLPQPQLPEK